MPRLARVTAVSACVGFYCIVPLASADLPVNPPAADENDTTSSDGPCGGRNPRPHSIGPYSFTTSSWVRVGDNGHYYRTCVYNQSDDHVLWFDWFTPGPTSYVPSKKSVTSSRFFTDRNTNDFPGCIQFGNHRDDMRETFLGNEKDREQIKAEKDAGCKISRSAQSTSHAPATLSKIAYSTTLYVPSDSKRIRETLVRLDLGVSLNPTREGEALFKIEYVAKGYYPQSEANFSRITLRTESTVLQTAVFKAGVSKSKDGLIHLRGEKGDVSVKVPVPSNFLISNSHIDLLDENQQRVGAVFVPVPVPGPVN